MTRDFSPLIKRVLAGVFNNQCASLVPLNVFSAFLLILFLGCRIAFEGKTTTTIKPRRNARILEIAALKYGVFKELFL